MTLILTRQELERGRLKFNRLLKWKIFIYPTDTIYGLGCNAENENLVERLRELKEQFMRPLSIIPPGMNWIKENCVLTPLAKEWLKRLPGPYTLIVKLKKRAVASNVDLGTNMVGVRLPDHWFLEWVKQLGVPIVTTSVNCPGSDFMTSIDSLPDSIKKGTDFIVYEGEIKGSPSSLVDVTMRLKRQMLKRATV